MGYEKLTLKTFEKKLNENGYAEASGARRAVGKASDMSDKDKSKANALIDAKFPKDAKAPKVAKKPAGKSSAKAPKVAKKAKVPAKAIKEETPAPTEKRKGKPGPKPKGVAKTPRGRRASDQVAEPTTSTSSTWAPPLSSIPTLTADDVASNPIHVRGMITDLVNSSTRAYETARLMAQDDANFPIGPLREQAADALTKAMALAGVLGGTLHEAAVRSLPTNSVPNAPTPLDPKSQAVFDQAAAAAQKVHGTNSTAAPATRA